MLRQETHVSAEATLTAARAALRATKTMKKPPPVLRQHHRHRRVGAAPGHGHPPAPDRHRVGDADVLHPLRLRGAAADRDQHPDHIRGDVRHPPPGALPVSR
eukprot:704407-Pyramimonas_sp.AAC.1